MTESDSDEDEDDVVDLWKCIGENCNALVTVRDSMVEEHELHTCQPTLKMDVDTEYGILDGYIFHKDTGNNAVQTLS